ncbi:MAG: hypothetical protein JKY19_14960 [Alcanivoracaceae bacterium]|nr:hypothetical protein [Alcanivoracaceae bacterium]
MKIYKIIFYLILVQISVNLKAQVISDYLTEVNYSMAVDYINADDISLFHNDVVVDTFAVVDSTESPAVIRNLRGARVDGYHKDSAGLRYFSFDADTRINGVSILKSDVIRCNDVACSAFIFFFDASAESLKHININAFTLDPENGELIFSVANATLIDGVQYLPSDLIRFNSAGNYSLEYNGASVVDGLGAYRNIDAVTLLANSYYIISLSNDGNYNGEFSYRDSYVLQYYPPTQSWSIAYTPLSLGSAFNQVNITSLMGFENDLIFKNSFD